MQATRQIDDRGRLTLPKSYANSTVIVEEIGEDEIRIRRAAVMPMDEFRFREEFSIPLSDVDRDLFLETLEAPPEPNDALRKIMNEARETGENHVD